MTDRRYQTTCVVLALVILLVVRFPRWDKPGAAGLEQKIQEHKQKVVPVRAEVKHDVMIEFPILVLGGFRGPLVMGLWIKAEDEKYLRNWWNVKTYHEIIAHLQPNFPSVYVYNAWNLAYNLSVQWHELPNKYQWVLDGARYAQKGIWINPESPDVMFQLADIYDQKLGRSQPERFYYRQSFAQDTVRVAKLVEKMSAEQRKDLANSTLLSDRDKAALVVVEKNGRLELTPVDLQEYPYGVSPFYFGYEYQAWLRRLGPHSNLSKTVVNVRPAVNLMGWSRSEMLTAVAWAEQMIGRTDLSKEEREAPILPSPIGPVNPQPGSPRWNELKGITLFHFDESERRFSQAIESFKKHLEKYPAEARTHEKHIHMCTYQRAISRGRRELFKAMCAILENKNIVSEQAAGYLNGAFADFKSAMGTRQSDGTYPPGSLIGYQIKHYPLRELDIHQQDRKEMQGLVEELRLKMIEATRLFLSYEAADARPVKVDRSLLKLHEKERHF